jgi:hypothetical protein
MYAGLHFQLLDDGRILYMDNVPHGSFGRGVLQRRRRRGNYLHLPGKPITALFVFDNGAKLAFMRAISERDATEPTLTVGILEDNAFTMPDPKAIDIYQRNILH